MTPGQPPPRPAVDHAVEVDEEDRLVGTVGMRDARAQPAGDERQVRVGVARLDGALLGIEVVAALEAVVLVAGAFGKQRPEGVDVGRNVLCAQPRRQAAIEEARRSCATTSRGSADRRRQRLVFGGEPGSQVDDVETRPRSKLERHIERF